MYKLKQRGFTVIELIVVIVALSIAGTAVMNARVSKANEAIIDKSHELVLEVGSALKKYRIDRGTWPSNLNELTTRNYLPAQSLIPALGGTYGYSVTNSANGGYVTLSIQMQTRPRAESLAGLLAHGVVVGQTTATTKVYRAGMEVSLEGLRQEVYNNFYQVDGMTNIRSDVDFRGFSALNLDKVYARAYYDLDDPTKIVDPSHTSILNLLETEGIDTKTLDADHIIAGRIDATRLLTSPDSRLDYIRSNTIVNDDQMVTRQINANRAVFDKITINSVNIGDFCNDLESNIGVTSEGAAGCWGSRWVSSRLKFGNPGPGAQIIAASVVGNVNTQGGNEICTVSANGFPVVQGWSGGGELVTGGGTIIPTNGNVNITRSGNSCRGGWASTVGYFYY